MSIEHLKLVPFPAILVPLSSFFATEKVDGQNYSSKQNEVIKMWFWRSLFCRRYSSDVNERQAADILQMDSLIKDENYQFKLPPPEIRIDFIKSAFSASSANSKTMISMLNQCSPHSLLSGAKINLAQVLKKGSKHEYHHIFPKKHLETLGVSKRDINSLANICFLTRSDNNSIKDKSPSVYDAQINSTHRDTYLSGALIPLDFSTVDYKSFVFERKKLLENKAKELMG